MITLRRWLRNAPEAFWFLPAILLVAAALLAEVMVGLDRALVGQGIAELPFVNAVGASGSRDLLAAIGGSMLGVAATSFSITISVIATASSTYGPRLVRNFMANRGNQLVLGTFGATFLYALLVLRTVREDTTTAPAFVPHLAVTVAIGLAVLDVVVLIWFIHHIADSIQVPTLAAQVLHDLQRSIAEAVGRRSAGPEAATPTGDPDLVVRAESHGFLQHVDLPGLVQVATELDAVVRVRPRAGDHLLAGDVLAEAWTGGSVDPGRVRARLERQLVTGRTRTPRQDLRFAVQQLAELAVRAMSTGTNDPYTAITAITELGTGLSEIVDLDDSAATHWHDGAPRVIMTGVSVVELVDLAFDQIRSYTVSSTEVVLTLLGLGDRLADRTDRDDVRSALRRQQATLRRQFAASDPDIRDLERVDPVASTRD